MCHSTEIMVGEPPVAIGASTFELRLCGLFNRVRVLKNLRPRRLDSHGVSDRELIQYGGYCFE